MLLPGFLHRDLLDMPPLRTATTAAAHHTSYGRVSC
jgi:hypothetical protein